MESRPLISSDPPYLPIVLRVQTSPDDAVELELSALVDTGFDGDVVIPAGLIVEDHRPDGYLSWTLADGSEVLSPSYEAQLWLGHLGPIEVAVSVLGGEPVIGRDVTDLFRVTFDRGERVIVEP